MRVVFGLLPLGCFLCQFLLFRPFDVFESRPTDAYLRQMLLAALAANMNSVRL